MTTSLWTFTGETTRWWLRATWLRWIEYRSSAITRDLLKHRLSAGITSTLVTKLWTCVSFAFQRSTTHTSADVLCLNILLSRAEMRSELATRSLALVRSLLSRAASVSARVTTTVQIRLTLARTHGRLNRALVADGLIVSTTTLAFNVDLTQTSATRTDVTQLFARMAAR